MTQQGFEEYLYTIFGRTNGTAYSYITAIRIIDEIFSHKVITNLHGVSIIEINNGEQLSEIADLIIKEQAKFINGDASLFDSVNPSQRSYPKKRFCSAAIRQLLKYYEYDAQERKASKMMLGNKKGISVSRTLATVFDIDREGKDSEKLVRVRLGQNYFRKMVLSNYDNKCCVTGLNIPQTLRASHIVAWANSKTHRMNPENGLCLSATYDAAFDRHLISFDDDYRMIVSKEIKDYFTNDIANEYFAKYEGKQITMPRLYQPSKSLLAKHREQLIG